MIYRYNGILLNCKKKSEKMPFAATRTDVEGFPGDSVGKNLPVNAGYLGLIPGLG